MSFFADLHLHSKYSRATSSDCDLEHLWLWAQLKGIGLVGTGDFTHPAWLDELRTKLVESDGGLYELREEYAAPVKRQIPPACAAPVKFVPTAEIANIYKRMGRVRKVHNVVVAPSLDIAAGIHSRLDAIGNVRSDGRPILGLDSRDLLEIVLEAGPGSFLIPAHIWTPWFSVLGSRSGFDCIDDCYGDLAMHIGAVETGLSSDPPMNRRLSSLDKYALVSHSDAHSPAKLGREADEFETGMSYDNVFRALHDRTDMGLKGTVEFFPEEGKYHFDGHRRCSTRLHPKETSIRGGLCPVCGRTVTVGVMARVEQLADREEGTWSTQWRGYRHLVPLPEILGESLGVGPQSKQVRNVYQAMLASLGSELGILLHAPLDTVCRVAGPVAAEGIRRVREGAVHIEAGYDGEYGTIRIFDERERRDIGRKAALVSARGQ